MPQDTTIYWDGEGHLPALIDSLPLKLQQQVLESIRSANAESAYQNPSGTYILFTAFIVLFSIAAIYSNNKTKREAVEFSEPAGTNTLSQPTPLVYRGNELGFSNKLLSEVLVKRFPYYNSLSETDKLKFMRRLQKFLELKTFVIHDESGFKEMPILVSATAVQVCFGLDKYLLPDFRTFHIYPAAFIGTHPFLRILAGNVSGNEINLSWTHFLEGFQYPDDGQNVGMHEIAHALHYQTFVVQKNADRDFRDTFVHFDSKGNKAFDTEKQGGPALYSIYAMKDFQEFWAESVELFFEKPGQMKSIYPDLYSAMCDLLNQDPASLS